MISVVLLTYRPGGFDILTSSIRDTVGDWELVVVDDWPGRVQRGTAQEYLRSQHIPLGWYGGSKPKSYPGTKGGLINAANTALSHCRGDFIVFVSDYTMLPPFWLAHWQAASRHYGPGTLLSGVAVEWKADKPPTPDDIHTWQKGEPFLRGAYPVSAPACIWRLELGKAGVNLRRQRVWKADVMETFYVGYNLSDLLELDGFDERSDHCHAWPVSSLVAQAKLKGWTMEVCPSLICDMVDHRAWDDPSQTAPWGIYDGLWRIVHGQSLPEEPVWEVPSWHPGWSLVEARKGNGL